MQFNFNNDGPGLGAGFVADLSAAEVRANEAAGCSDFRGIVDGPGRINLVIDTIRYDCVLWCFFIFIFCFDMLITMYG